jgi:hypothetical protein
MSYVPFFAAWADIDRPIKFPVQGLEEFVYDDGFLISGKWDERYYFSDATRGGVLSRY